MLALLSFIVALLSTAVTVHSLLIIYVLTGPNPVDITTPSRNPLQTPSRAKVLRGNILLLSLAATYLLAYFGVFS